MGWLDWLPGRKPSAALPEPAPAPTPDGSAFVRESMIGAGQFGRASVGTAQLLALAASSVGHVSERTKPQDVPYELIESMRFDPWIYLGERMFAAPLQDPTLYFVKHPDPAIKAETEAWLRKLLPSLLREVTRAFALGCSPYVLDWEAADIAFHVKRGDAARFLRTRRAHQHFQERVHRIRGPEAQLEIQNDRLVSIHYGGGIYGADRAFASVWDDEACDWRGNGSRYRCWPAYYKGAVNSVLEGRWAERGVDPPRIGRAPNGMIKIDGEEIPATTLLTDALMALKGGDAAVLPSGFDPNTNQPLWAVDVMNLPDVSGVWRTIADSCSAEKLLGSLVPPSSAGVGESAGFAGARIPNEMFVELIEAAASWVAEQIECVTDVVHKVNHGTSIAPPEIEAREIPKAKIKRLMEFIRVAGTIPRHVAEGREVTLAELVDESILDEVGIPRRPTEEAARKPRGSGGSGSPGRDPEPLSDRQERRENAREVEGEDATGAPGEGVDS